MSDAPWVLFLVLAVGAIVIAMGAPLGPVFLFLGLFTVLFAYEFPYLTFYAVAFLTPFLGVTISVPTGELAVGERAFGGAVDISFAETLLLVLLGVWAVKIAVRWIRHRERTWKPRFPLFFPVLSLTAAHLVSAFSPLLPDPVLVVKYSLRPVLLSYLGYVALPVNFIRTKKRLVALLWVMVSVGMVAGVNGVLSLFSVGPSSQFIRRAHPLPLFGVPILGDNHNLLAELMVVTTLITLALVVLTAEGRMRRLLYGAAFLQFAVGLLTFSRTGWITFAIQAVFLGFVEFRPSIRRYARQIVIALLLLLPFAGYMANLSLSRVASSSNETRVALSEIAWDVFRSSPLIGAGAGTFVGIVGSSHVFRLEFGDPLDSHGVLQKLAAETGLLGLAAFLWVIAVFFRTMLTHIRSLHDENVRRVTVLLTASALGAIMYQLFNTNYWTGKMWLPVGIALASISALTSHPRHEKTANPSRHA